MIGVIISFLIGVMLGFLIAAGEDENGRNV